MGPLSGAGLPGPVLRPVHLQRQRKSCYWRSGDGVAGEALTEEGKGPGLICESVQRGWRHWCAD